MMPTGLMRAFTLFLDQTMDPLMNFGIQWYAKLHNIS